MNTKWAVWKKCVFEKLCILFSARLRTFKAFDGWKWGNYSNFSMFTQFLSIFRVRPFIQVLQKLDISVFYWMKFCISIFEHFPLIIRVLPQDKVNSLLNSEHFDGWIGENNEGVMIILLFPYCIPILLFPYEWEEDKNLLTYWLTHSQMKNHLLRGAMPHKCIYYALSLKIYSNRPNTFKILNFFS